MFIDPVPVAAAAPNPAYSFAVVKSDGYGAVRVDTLGSNTEMVVQHTPGKGSTRHYVKLSFPKDAINPYTGQTQRVSASISLSISYPTFGFSDADKAAFWLALKSVIDDSDVTIARILQKQS